MPTDQVLVYQDDWDRSGIRSSNKVLVARRQSQRSICGYCELQKLLKSISDGFDPSPTFLVQIEPSSACTACGKGQLAFGKRQFLSYAGIEHESRHRYPAELHICRWKQQTPNWIWRSLYSAVLRKYCRVIAMMSLGFEIFQLKC